MIHMSGDYISNIPTGPGLWLALIFWVLLVVGIVVSLRIRKVKAMRRRRSTYREHVEGLD